MANLFPRCKITFLPGFLLAALACSLFSCEKHVHYTLQPEYNHLDKNIPENTTPKDFVEDPQYDVYVVGHSIDSFHYENGYWKNGLWTSLANDTILGVYDLFADDAHVYLAGDKSVTIGGIGGYQAYYWVDNTPVKLESGPDKLSDALGIAVYNGKVYTCGRKSSEGAIWENEKLIYTVPGVTLTNIKFVNGDRYTAGSYEDANGRLRRVLYKNEQKIFQFLNNSEGFGAAVDVTANGWAVSGLSESGQDLDGQNFVINGVEKKISFTPDNYCHINALSITPDQKILLAGTLFFDLDQRFAGLWRDGHFDRVETRFRSELMDVKTTDDNREFILGNVYFAGSPAPGNEQNQAATLWIDGIRYQIKGPYRSNHADRLFIKKK